MQDMRDGLTFETTNRSKEIAPILLRSFSGNNESHWLSKEKIYWEYEHKILMSIKYLKRPSIHHKYIQRVTISSWKHMSFADVEPYIRKQSRKLEENKTSSEEIHIFQF
jgi:hypothetical protein